MALNEKSARFEELFRKGGLAFKRVNAFGSQIHVTCWSRGAAEKIARVLRAATFDVYSITESVDYNEENRGTCLRPTTHAVWLVGARVSR